MGSQSVISAEESLAKAREVIRRTIAGHDDRNSLVTQIVVEVGAEIIEEVIPPGHDLNSVELARRYNTSRTPIREALMLLEKEGLVDIPPRRRPRVKVYDLQTIREIYRTRATLLEFIASDVALYASEEKIGRLKAQLEKMARSEQLNDALGYMWNIIEFYDLNSDASANQTAKRIVEALLLRTITLRRWSLSQTGRVTESLDDHRRLVKAYEARDSHLAAALIRSNHIAALKRIEKRYLTEQTTLSDQGQRNIQPG